MSHGEGTPRDYGSKTNVGRVPDAPTGPIPGTPEYDALLQVKAAELVQEIKEMYPKLKGVWSQADWFARAERSGEQYLRNARLFVDAKR